MTDHAVISQDLLRVENLRIGFGPKDDRREVVKGVSFSLAPGRCLAIVGESGSGKSVTARSLVGLTGGNSHLTADRLEFDGHNLTGLNDRGWQQVRGRDIGFVLQDALVSLDQLRPVGKEVDEGLRLHGWGTKAERRGRVLELLEQVGIPEPALRVRQLPHELSGGQRQRALIASAIALDPKLIIADEPTTALDVTVQARILALLESIRERGSALILISHDLAVVSRMADEVAVMRHGEIVERGVASEVFANPQHPYTQALLDAIPSTRSKGTRLSPHSTANPAAVAEREASTVGVAGPRGAAASSAANHALVRLQARHENDETPVLEARNVVKKYKGPDGTTRTVVDGVSFKLAHGETLGVVGESGSGKTTTARVALALAEADGGTVLLGGKPWSGIPERQRRARRSEISVIYQDPLSSFDPRWSVEKILIDSLPPGKFTGEAARRDRVTELMKQVGLEDEHRSRRPLQLSGGQRQRVAIARALGPEPSVIVCDEPVSALDVSIQAQVLDLLTDLQAELGLSYLFISHDLGVIHHMSDHVLVLSEGKVVETGTADEVFNNPQKPYTQQLLAALPTFDVPSDASQIPAAARTSAVLADETTTVRDPSLESAAA